MKKTDRPADRANVRRLCTTRLLVYCHAVVAWSAGTACGCERPPQQVVGPRDSSATVDAETTDAAYDSGTEQDGEIAPDLCPLGYGGGPCAHYFVSECEPSPMRWLELQYVSQVWPAAGVIEDQSTWEACWTEHSYYRDWPNPPPLGDPPAVDFDTELVVWHCYPATSTGYVLEPEMWDCGDCLVFVPKYQSTGGDEGMRMVSLVAIPRTDLRVRFAETVIEYP